MEQKPRLEAFIMGGPRITLVPSSPSREWMDNFPDRHPYRCLPLSIANAHGWDVLCPVPLEITWNGGPLVSDLTIRATEPLPDSAPLEHFTRSNFSRGILTLHTGYLFRTPPGWNLLATGPFNKPKPGIAPLTGIIETDWLPYPFTMNWQMLGPGTVRFEKDEAFCTLVPIPKDYLQNWDVVTHDLKDDPVLECEQNAFKEARDAFMVRFNARDPEALKQAWQRHYFVGRHPDGRIVDNHTNKLRLAEPQSRSGTRPLYAKTQSIWETPTITGQASISISQPSSQSVRFEAAKPQGFGYGFLTADITACPAHQMPDSGGAGKKWRRTSRLNGFNDEQNVENFAGRQRVQGGIITPTPTMRYVTAASDLTALDFVMVPDFLDAASCKLLCDTSKALSSQQVVEGVKDPYWQGRMLFYHNVKAAAPEAAHIMKATIDRSTAKVGAFYELTAPIYADLLQIVQWREGLFMNPHADGMRPDGTPHEFAHRKFGCIIYLNDDYEGGELYFTRLDTAIRPKAGMLVAFTGGFHHEHAVLKVTKGLRMTMPTFFTFDETHKDKTLYGG